ncbi:DPP IV N-terminal domain-containing protein [Sphingomonas naphthae]|uniref:DPP IV N-terminal domain-containing protein n=1 Tax=Sphingomonas naphthae TaxID=1813468 RepID=A0ABY7TNH6_9SPHN|nr:DPP IV N-terminal domain-containing protein [Sphingomonas naphthae]WCT74793.1 DPP IV N-terminal domain-containing protein [Sphingomonas naphthae]
MNRILGFAAAAIAMTASLSATPAAAEPLTLDRVFASPSLSGPTPRGLRLSPDGKMVTLLLPRDSDKDRYDLWAIDTANTANRRMLVDSAKVGSGADVSEAEKMRRERLRIGGTRGITAYDWAPDGKSILVPLDGDLYLATLDGNVRRLTNTPATEIDAKVSQDGKFVSFVRDQNFYVIDLATGAERQLSKDGQGTITWGTAEFVAQEEMDRYTGHWWSPTDGRIAVQRTDEAPVKVVSRASIGAKGTRVFDQRYPAAGTPNAVVELWLMNPDGTGRVKVDLGTNTDIYLARVNWGPGGKALYVQRENRAQTRLDMLKVDPATGASTLLFTETAKPKSWITLSDDLRILRDDSLIWWSERDGHGHLYRYAAGKWTQLTKGAWEVQGIIGLDQDEKKLWFTGNRETPLEGQVYTLDYERPGSITRLSEKDWSYGTARSPSASMDRSATRMLMSRSSPDQPTQTYLADNRGKMIAWINENKVVAGHPYYPYLAQHRPSQFGTMKAADGSVLHWQMITPALEPGKKYPVFFQHYGGPGSQTVSRGWMSPIAQYLVSKGWIFFQIDNRGSANRGVAFGQQIWHAMGTVEVDDQVAAAKWLKTQPFVDGAKIATYGWSYGGYMSLKMLQKAPGVFAAAIAGAPVTDWTLYDTHYTERFLGDPRTDLRSYQVSNALADATKIRDPLLMIHGMADDNVVFENSTAFYAALQEAKVPFEMMVYPGKTHGVSGEGAQTHVWKTIENFLDVHVKK